MHPGCCRHVWKEQKVILHPMHFSSVAVSILAVKFPLMSRAQTTRRANRLESNYVPFHSFDERSKYTTPLIGSAVSYSEAPV